MGPSHLSLLKSFVQTLWESEPYQLESHSPLSFIFTYLVRSWNQTKDKLLKLLMRNSRLKKFLNFFSLTARRTINKEEKWNKKECKRNGNQNKPRNWKSSLPNLQSTWTWFERLVNISISRLIEENKIPFDLEPEESFYQLKPEVQEGILWANAHLDELPCFKTVEEMNAWIDVEDK